MLCSGFAVGPNRYVRVSNGAVTGSSYAMSCPSALSVHSMRLFVAEPQYSAAAQPVQPQKSPLWMSGLSSSSAP